MLVPIRVLFRTYWIEIVVVCALVVMVFWSYSTLLTKPKIWIDEALTLEISRNLAQHGTLNAKVAPDEWYAQPYLLQETGYPITTSLAGFFKVFGYGFTQARTLMLVWIVLALGALFCVFRSLISREIALQSFLLLVTFASLYANGRPATGEIPGFAFFILGLYFWLKRENLWCLGFLWGFAVVTKPSVFVFLIPAITITLLFQNKPFLDRVKDILHVGISMLPAGMLWMFLVLPHPFSPAAWHTIVTFYAHPFSADGVAAPTVISVFSQPTLMYFALWLAVLLFAWRYIKDAKIKLLYLFTFIYTIFTVINYLRSPGWLRYILISEFLILALLPHALHTLQERFGYLLPSRFAQKSAVILVSAVIIFQFVQLNTTAKLYTSVGVLRTAEYLNMHYPHASIAAVGTLTTYALLNSENRSVYIRFPGIPSIGSNLTKNNPKGVVVADVTTEEYLESKAVLEKEYRKVTTIDAFEIYERASR